jgi:hypothetical protein
MADTITVRKLADKVGLEARALRRLLRSQFPRETKGKAYEWQPGDPQIASILKAAKNGHRPGKTGKPKTATKTPAAKKPTVKVAKKTPEIAGEKEESK